MYHTLEEAAVFLWNPVNASLFATMGPGAAFNLTHGRSCILVLPAYHRMMAWTVLSTVEGDAKVVVWGA